MAIYPGKYNPMKPDIELFDYKSKKRYGLKLDGPSALQVGTISQDDTVHIRTQGKRIGDFDEQRSWKSGRGVENLSSNGEGFWDAKDTWTLTPEKIHPTPLWRFAKGIRSSQLFMPDTTSVSWGQLFGDTRYLDTYFTADETFTADYARLWIMRRGHPGTLTVEICSNSSTDPDTVLASATITASDVVDVTSVLKKFDWSSTINITSSTIYHVKIYGASTDNKNNHWVVGGYSAVAADSNKRSSDGTTWTAGTFKLYYYIAPADISRTFESFVLDDAFYLVTLNDSSAVTAKLYINGDRGRASAGSTTVLTDSGKSWTTNRWANARVKIIRGTGAGQTSAITSNNTTQLAVSFGTSIGSDSEYVIYSTPWFTELSGTGLAWVASRPVVVNQIAYFPQGGANAIRRMIWTGTAHSFSADGSNTSHFLHSMSGSDGTIRIWSAHNSLSVGNPKVVYVANSVQWANPPTALTFGSAIYVGDATHQIKSLADKDGLLYVFKEDGPRTVSNNQVVSHINNGVNKTPSYANGIASISHQQFLYYSWLHSLIRVYGSSHDDIGQDWRSQGLPDGREGVFRSLDSYTSLLIAALDAGPSGTSSVLAWDGIGWHELLRAYDSGKRIRYVKVQACEGTRNKMWVDVGGDLIFQDMPLQKASPYLDSGLRYMHEAVIESSAIDMGTASGLPKFIKELTVFAKNLGNKNSIHIDYQVDDDVHTSNWTEATSLFQSPEAVAFLGLSNVRKFAYRLRIMCGDNTSPPMVLGVVPNGYARVPYKMTWTMRCRADNITSRGRLAKPDQLMRWLLDNARYPGRVEMRSQYEMAHKYFVIIHPPRMFPYKPAQNGQAEESILTLVLEEA